MLETALSAELRDEIAPVLGRIPSGVYILTAAGPEGQTTGLLASWIQQAGFTPPQITVAVNKSRYLNSWLSPGSAVTLNQVPKGDNVLFRHFSKGFDPNVDAFVGMPVKAGANGLPLLTNAMASLEGRVESSLEASDHVIFLVTVTRAHSHRAAGDAEPFVHIRKNGFSY